MIRKICVGIAWYLVIQIVLNYSLSTWLHSLEINDFLSVVVAVLLTTAGMFSGILPGSAYRQKEDRQSPRAPVSLIVRSIPVVGLLFMLYQIPVALALSLGGSGTPPLEWSITIFSMGCLLVAGFGIIFEKRWAWYLCLIVIPLYCVGVLTFGLRHGYPVECLLMVIFPLLVLGFIHLPKVKLQFRG